MNFVWICPTSRRKQKNSVLCLKNSQFGTLTKNMGYRHSEYMNKVLDTVPSVAIFQLAEVTHTKSITSCTTIYSIALPHQYNFTFFYFIKVFWFVQFNFFLFIKFCFVSFFFLYFFLGGWGLGVGEGVTLCNLTMSSQCH